MTSPSIRNIQKAENVFFADLIFILSLFTNVFAVLWLKSQTFLVDNVFCVWRLFSRLDLRPATWLKRKTLAQVFSVGFAKILRISFLKNTSEWQLLSCSYFCDHCLSFCFHLSEFFGIFWTRASVPYWWKVCQLKAKISRN